MGDADELTSLVKRLGGRDWRDVGAAFRALAAAGDAGRVAVREGLAHPNARVRAACADFYDHLGSDADVPALCGLLADPVPSVRRQAAHSLGCQRCKPAPLQTSLVETLSVLALTDPTPRVRREAVVGLGNQAPDPRTVTTLHQVLATDDNAKVRREAHRALRQQSLPYRHATDEAARARQQGAGLLTPEIGDAREG